MPKDAMSCFVPPSNPVRVELRGNATTAARVTAPKAVRNRKKPSRRDVKNTKRRRERKRKKGKRKIDKKTKKQRKYEKFADNEKKRKSVMMKAMTKAGMIDLSPLRLLFASLRAPGMCLVSTQRIPVMTNSTASATQRNTSRPEDGQMENKRGEWSEDDQTGNK